MKKLEYPAGSIKALILQDAGYKPEFSLKEENEEAIDEIDEILTNARDGYGWRLKEFPNLVRLGSASARIEEDEELKV